MDPVKATRKIITDVLTEYQHDLIERKDFRVLNLNYQKGVIDGLSIAIRIIEPEGDSNEK